MQAASCSCHILSRSHPFPSFLIWHCFASTTALQVLSHAQDKGAIPECLSHFHRLSSIEGHGLLQQDPWPLMLRDIWNISCNCCQIGPKAIVEAPGMPFPCVHAEEMCKLQKCKTKTKLLTQTNQMNIPEHHLPFAGIKIVNRPKGAPLSCLSLLHLGQKLSFSALAVTLSREEVLPDDFLWCKVLCCSSSPALVLQCLRPRFPRDSESQDRPTRSPDS